MRPLSLHTPNGPPASDRPGTLPDGQAPSAKRPGAGLAPMLLSAADLAALLRVSSATIWRLRASGKLPRPLNSLGRQLLRWNADEVRRWVKAGMPDLRTWEVLDRR